jgi:hypothetical protein
VLNLNSFEPASSFNFYTGSGPRVQNFRQPGYSDFDSIRAASTSALEKSVQITERLKFQLRGDALNIFNQHLWLPKTLSELKTQRLRAFMRSLCDYDEFSSRRPSRLCHLQFSNPCRPAGGDLRASSPTRCFPKERAAALAPPGPPTGSCGSCSRDGGPVDPVVCTSFARIRLSLGTVERPRGTGPGNHWRAGSRAQPGRSHSASRPGLPTPSMPSAHPQPRLRRVRFW